MTFEQKMMEMLEGSGMSRGQAEEVVKFAKAGEQNAPMEKRWHDDISGYPPVMVNVLWMAVKDAAVEWIDSNCPQAWFRGCFV